MALRPVPTDPFDDLLLEAFEAERAGVFGRTPVDARELAARPVAVRSVRFHRYFAAGLPLAASVALFLGLATFWKAGSGFSNTPADANRSSTVADGLTGDAAEKCQSLENLRTCFTGPGNTARAECRCVDFDADGDVDQRDFSVFQLSDSGR